LSDKTPPREVSGAYDVSNEKEKPPPPEKPQPDGADQVEEEDITMDDFVPQPGSRSPSPAAAQLSATQKESEHSKPSTSKSFMERAKEITGFNAKAPKEDAAAAGKPKEDNVVAPVAPMGVPDSRTGAEKKPVQKAKYSGPPRGKPSKRKFSDRTTTENSDASNSKGEPEKKTKILDKVSGVARRRPTRPTLPGARGPTRAEFAALKSKTNSPTTAPSEAPAFTAVNNRMNAGPVKRTPTLRPAAPTSPITDPSLKTPRLFQADALRTTFGGPQRGFFTRLTDPARASQLVDCAFFITINPKEHYEVPQSPAKPCTLLAVEGLEDPLEIETAFPLFCKLDKSKYLYCGEYKLGERRTLTVQEWSGLAPEVQKFWKGKMKVSSTKRSRELMVERGVIGPKEVINVPPEKIQDFFEAPDDQPNLRMEATCLDFVGFNKETYNTLLEQSEKNMDKEETLNDVAPYLNSFLKAAKGPENIFPDNKNSASKGPRTNGAEKSSAASVNQSASSAPKVLNQKKKIPMSEQSAEYGAEDEIFARRGSGQRRTTLPTDYSLHNISKKAFGKLSSNESSSDDEDARPSENTTSSTQKEKGKQPRRSSNVLDIDSEEEE
jgi:hypothetical protein